MEATAIEIREEDGVDMEIVPISHACRLCDRTYLSTKALRNHERKRHNVIHEVIGKDLMACYSTFVCITYKIHIFLDKDCQDDVQF